MTTKEKIHNAVNDPKVTFFLFPTEKLKEMLLKNEHPYAQKLTNSAKAALISGKVLPVSKEDVLDFIEKKLKPDRYWLMSTGEVRASGCVNILANEVNKNS